MSADRRRVVILGGAGAMGRITARDMVRTASDLLETVVGDLDLEAARAQGTEGVQVDVTNPDSLGSALEGAYAVIASLPYRFNLNAMRGALASGAHYIDLGGLFHMTRKQLELKAEFEAAGLMAVLGTGSAPGIINVLAVLASQDLERVSEIHCQVGAADRSTYKNTPPLGFDYSVDTLLDEYLLDSAVYRKGEWLMVPALAPEERTEAMFPEPVGKLWLESTLHSEVATLPLVFKERGIEEVTFRQGFDQEFMDKLRFLVDMGLANTEKLPELGVAPRKLLLTLLGRFPPAELVGEPQSYEILRAVVRGERDGQPVTVTADCEIGPQAGNGEGTDIGTGGPPSIVAQLMKRGDMEIRPGVWPAEAVVPVAPFVRELERRDMKVSTREG